MVHYNDAVGVMACLPDGTSPLAEPMLTYREKSPVEVV